MTDDVAACDKENGPPKAPALKTSAPEETGWAELDVRSLALFRVALGLFVLLTLAQSFPHWRAFFTDSGVLPRQALLASPYANSWLSFHLGGGHLYTQVLLNSLLASLAVGVILGWRTPWMLFGCWLLLGSLTARNPFIFDRGNLQLALSLFWGLFLPLGARWSLDARAGRAPHGSHRGLGAAALVAQFAQIYLFTAYLKNGPFWLVRGDGLEHSLISPLFATKLSLWLADAAAPWLPLLNYAVIAGELLVGLLLLCPWSVPLTRGLAVLALLGFHLSVGCLFTLGIFPWQAAALALGLVPKEFWDGLGHRLQTRFDQLFGPSQPPAHPSPPLAQRLRSAMVACCLTLTVLSNVSFATGYPSWARVGPVREVSNFLRLSQHWELFSPTPPFYGHFVVKATHADGSVATVFEGPPTRERPELSPFPSHGWRMLMIASLFPGFEAIRPGIAYELARRAGISEPEQSAFDYAFEVRLPDDSGRLQPAPHWQLWRSEAGPLKGKSAP